MYSRSVLLIFSLNSSEIGVLAGLPTQDVCNWQQWFMVNNFVLITIFIYYLNLIITISICVFLLKKGG